VFKKFIPLAICGLALLALAPSAARLALASPSSVTFTVNSPLDRIDDNVGDGICHTASGTCTLRAAVMEADVASSTAGATIILPAGIYSLTIPAAVPDGPENGDLNLIAGNPMISIVGAGAASTIIDANQNDRVLSVQKGRTASLSGVTLRGGSLVNDYGGGINNNGILALDRVTVSGNDAGAADGTGGGIENGGVMTVTESTIGPDNTAYYCAGICNDGTLLVDRSTIAGNHASVGGGIYQDPYYHMFLINSTISHNSAIGDGGGIFNNGTANVYNTSIVFNSADSGNAGGSYGGGVDNGNFGTFNLRNTLVAGNNSGNTYPDDCHGTLGTYGNNLFTQASPCTLVPADAGTTGVLNSVALLGPLADNGGPTQTHALLAGSNAIDGGDPFQGCVDNNSVPLATDQRGFPRVVGASCDIGAFEYLPPAAFLPIVLR